MPDMSRLQTYQPQALAVLRIVTALVFMQHGLEKLFEFPGPHGPGPFVIFGRWGVAGILETFGGLAILLGLFTRPVAFILCGQMAVAFWWMHIPRGLTLPNGLFPVINGGDLALMFCFVFLYLFIAGPGAWSVDGMRNKD